MTASPAPTEFFSTQDALQNTYDTNDIRMIEEHEDEYMPGMSFSSGITSPSPSSSVALLTPPLPSYEDVEIAVHESQMCHSGDFTMVDDMTCNTTPHLAPQSLPEPKGRYLSTPGGVFDGDEKTEMSRTDSIELHLLAFRAREALHFKGKEDAVELERELWEANIRSRDERRRSMSSSEASCTTHEEDLLEDNRRSRAPSPEIPCQPTPDPEAEAAVDNPARLVTHEQDREESIGEVNENITLASRRRPASEELIWGSAGDCPAHLRTLGSTDEIGALSEGVIGLGLSDIVQPVGPICFESAFIDLEDFESIEELARQLGLDDEESDYRDSASDPATASLTAEALVAVEKLLHSVRTDTLRVHGPSAVGLTEEDEAEVPADGETNVDEECRNQMQEFTRGKFEPVEDEHDNVLAELMRSTVISV